VSDSKGGVEDNLDVIERLARELGQQTTTPTQMRGLYTMLGALAAEVKKLRDSSKRK
jgi:HAMP domain-containing protein